MEIKVGFQKQNREGFCLYSEVLVHQKIVSTQRLSMLFFLGNFSCVLLKAQKSRFVSSDSTSSSRKVLKPSKPEHSLPQVC
jgi:hypothetical protein